MQLPHCLSEPGFCFLVLLFFFLLSNPQYETRPPLRRRLSIRCLPSHGKDMSMGDRNDESPIRKTGYTGEVERAASLSPKEPSRSRTRHSSDGIGEKDGRRYLSHEQALKDVKRDRSVNTLEHVPRRSIENPSRIDPEVARYASNVKVQISKEENKRLRKMIDVRILTVMVFVSWSDISIFKL
jgi:hypothetical protein